MFEEQHSERESAVVGAYFHTGNSLLPQPPGFFVRGITTRYPPSKRGHPDPLTHVAGQTSLKTLAFTTSVVTSVATLSPRSRFSVEI